MYWLDIRVGGSQQKDESDDCSSNDEAPFEGQHRGGSCGSQSRLGGEARKRPVVMRSFGSGRETGGRSLRLVWNR